MNQSGKRSSYYPPDGNEIARAFRHPDNFEPILVCTVIFIVVGLLMMVTGGVICLIYYTEITPPNFDSNYHRYVGSSMPRIVGPLLIAFGGLLSAGDLVVIGMAVQQKMKKKPTYRDDPYDLKTTTSPAMISNDTAEDQRLTDPKKVLNRSAAA